MLHPELGQSIIIIKTLPFIQTTQYDVLLAFQESDRFVSYIASRCSKISVVENSQLCLRKVPAFIVR